MNRDRLYGRPGDEYLCDDLATVYEQAECDWDENHRPDLVLIEEWTVAEPIEHLPTAAIALEGIIEHYVSEEVVECVWDSWEDATAADEVIASMQATLDLLASKVTNRMADKHVATHIVTFDDEGEPILNGERLYRPVECPGQESLL